MRPALLPAALVSCMIATGAGASCETDLAAAREATRAAGPVRVLENFTLYESDGKTGRSSVIILDVIAPDRLRRISIFENGHLAEMVLIAGAGWSVPLGKNWEPLEAATAKQMLEAFKTHFPWASSPGQVSCSPAPDGNGKDATKFSFATIKDGASWTHEVLAERETGRALRHRYVVSKDGVRNFESDMAFRFIAGLEIEVPK
jgi:hypothetical protein